MAIVLNLLAERQHAEEIRRRDPVRRTLVASGICIGLALGCSLVLSLVSWQVKEEKRGIQLHWERLENENKQLTDALKKTATIEQNLGALQLLASNRFLWAPMLNAMQDCIVDQVQVSGVRVDQTYNVTTITPPGAKGGGRKPPVLNSNITEKIVLNIEARDYANGQFSKFQETISTHPFLRSLLTNGTVRLTGLTPPNRSDGEVPGKDHTTFKIEVAFPPVTRSEAR